MATIQHNNIQDNNAQHDKGDRSKALHHEEWLRLHQQLRGIARRRAMLDAEEARCLREAHRLRLWRHLGYVHMNEYLERELGYGPQVGIERLRVALALAELPQIEANLGTGSLPYSAVRELTRVATRDTECAWLDSVRGKNLRQIEALVAGKKRGDLPEDPPNPDLMTRTVRLDLTPAAFALFRQARSALADEYGSRLDDSALVEVLCRRALEGGNASERPSHQIAITVCESCGRGWQNGAGREIEVGREVVDRARCDAEVIGSLNAREPERVTSTVTPRIRRQVLARDHHRCTVPGCRSARNLDLHHIEYRGDGGSNDPSNLTTVCSGHHQQLHDGKLTIAGKAPQALEFVWARAVDQSARVPGESRLDATSAVRELLPQTPETEQPEDPARSARIDRGARAVLVSAGYKPREARAAVESARSHVGANATLEELIRDALRRCAMPPVIMRATADPEVHRASTSL